LPPARSRPCSDERRKEREVEKKFRRKRVFDTGGGAARTEERLGPEVREKEVPGILGEGIARANFRGGRGFGRKKKMLVVERKTKWGVRCLQSGPCYKRGEKKFGEF